jgi:hypothetical protein
MTAQRRRSDTSAQRVRGDVGALLHRALRLAWGLLLAMAALATWPLTVVAGAGYAVAWRRGWTAARLGRQAGWALPMTAVWIAAESARGWRAVGLDPVRDGDSGWPHLTVMTVVRTFLLVAPVTIPAGLALAALLWAWRSYVATVVQVARPEAAPLSLPATRAPVVLPAPRRASSLEDAVGPGARR